MIQQTLQWIFQNKLIVFLGICTFSFTIATIALAVDNQNYKDDLETCQSQLRPPATTTTPGPSTTTEGPPLVQNYRLPSDVEPKHYLVHLHPDLTSLKFKGRVEIDLDVKNAVDHIIMHDNDLDIDSMKLDDADLKPEDFEVVKNDTEFLIINTKGLTVGDHKLVIDYHGILNGSIVGFYASNSYGNAMRPVSYWLRLWPHLAEGNFTGSVRVHVRSEQPIERFLLDADGLAIQKATATHRDVGPLVISSTKILAKEQKIEMVLGKAAPPGDYDLELDFSGNLRNRIVGFYASNYTDSTGKERMIATSKFEPTYARQAFPCFDEPAMKARYTVELVAPKDYIALSNMDMNKEEPLDDMNKIVKFNTSVPMSTYLACFIVGDFQRKVLEVDTGGIGQKFDFGVYGVAEQLDKIEFALDFGHRSTEHFIKYFQVEYPLPKLDMIAVPDFVSGAMEHWGLVTFRETNMLYDVKTTSPSNMQNIARVIAHEISHMWFGNLVTMKWWNDLWLNEGFASYMQYKALETLEPEWKTLDQFLTSNTHSIMASDSKLSSHPIVQTVETPDQITAIFDSVTYNKGAAVIRMLENFVGEETFREGITEYLKRFKYGNTVTQDLLTVLEEKYKDPNITLVMDTWTRQMGLPVVSVTEKDPLTYELKQKRFLSNPEVEPDKNSPFDYKWYIPVTYKVEGGTPSDRIIWFPHDVDNIEIKLTAGETLLKINNDQVGYFRVNYEPKIWEKLKNMLIAEHGKFTISDRTNLLNDVFNLADANEVNYDLAFDISTYLTKEEDYVPWVVANSQFSSLKSIMSNSEAYIEYRRYVRGLVEGIFNKTRDEDSDKHIDRLMKATVYSLACSMGNEECLQFVTTEFKAWLNNGKPVDPNLSNIVYFYGVQETGEEEWQKVWDKFKAEKDPQEITKLMQALSASRDHTILLRYLELAWNEDNVRSQDHLNVVQNIAGNPIGTPLVWDHVRSQWPRFVERYTLNSRTLGTMIPGISRSFASQLKLDEMEAFFVKYPDAGAGATAREQAKENIKNNIKWLEKHEPKVKDWLISHSGKA